MNAGLILAGGTGVRAGSPGLPKQFCEVAGKPLIMYSLAAFERCRDIDGIAIVAAEHWRERLSEWIGRDGMSKFLHYAEPGRTRQHSVHNGLLSLRGKLGDGDRVVIHDAARPCVTASDIRRCIEAAKDGDGATPVIRPNDTIYRSTDGRNLQSLLPRDELFSGQTPECYDYAKYLAAHRNLSDEEIGAIRGSSEMAFRAGMKIRLCEGRAENIKITTETDLSYFRYLLEHRQ